jgi:hypothetical protein
MFDLALLAHALPLQLRRDAPGAIPPRPFVLSVSDRRHSGTLLRNDGPVVTADRDP